MIPIPILNPGIFSRQEAGMTCDDDIYDNLDFYPLTPDRWADLEQLFGEHGAYGGCWCMWWRSTRREFQERQGKGNRQALHDIVAAGHVPGLLAYAANRPVGWCSVAPREQFGALERSPVLKRLDDQPVWSIVCFFIAPDCRTRGVAEALLHAAVDYVRRQGGRIVEAYPTQPRQERLPDPLAYMGTPAMFQQAGFQECARPSKSRVILRHHIT
jgi:GNAT superfamily N-acetyltransferase